MNRPSKITAASSVTGSPAPLASLRGVSEAAEAVLPTCFTCDLILSRCSCPWPGDDEMMHVSDMKRVMPEFFADRGWALAEASAERSALLMPGSSGR